MLSKSSVYLLFTGKAFKCGTILVGHHLVDPMNAVRVPPWCGETLMSHFFPQQPLAPASGQFARHNAVAAAADVSYYRRAAAHSMARANLNKSKFFLTSSIPQHQSTYQRGPESASIEIGPHFIKFSKTFFYQVVNLVSQCSHLEVLLLSKFGSERGDFN